MSTSDLIITKRPKKLPYTQEILTVDSVNKVGFCPHFSEPSKLVFSGYPKWYHASWAKRKLTITHNKKEKFSYPVILAGEMEFNDKKTFIFLEV